MHITNMNNIQIKHNPSQNTFFPSGFITTEILIGLRLLKRLLASINNIWQFGSLVLLSIVFSAFFLVKVLSQSAIDHQAGPWLEERPHFIWSTSGCDSDLIDRITSDVLELGFDASIDCIRTRPISIVRAHSGPPVVAHTRALIYQPALRALLPGLRTNFQSARQTVIGSCLNGMDHDPLRTRDPDLHALVPECDLHERPLPIIAVGQRSSARNLLLAGQQVSAYARLASEHLPDMADITETPNRRDAIIYAVFETGIPYLDDAVIVPASFVENRGEWAADVIHLLAMRIHAPDTLEQLAAVHQHLKPAMQGHGVLIFSLVAGEIWETSAAVFKTLDLISGIVWTMTVLLTVISTGSAIEAQRKLFTLARVFGVRSPAITSFIFFFVILMVGAAMFLGAVLSLVCGTLLTTFSPQLHFTPQLDSYLGVIPVGLGLSIGVAVVLKWIHFKNDISDEFQRIAAGA